MNPSLSYNSRSGFTLVELAIVLTIVGLLIGGVLRGQEMMNNARVDSTIKQVMSYDAALYTFIDAYSAYPGDMNTATTRLPGCNAGTFCQDGNNDGLVGTPDNIWVGGQQGVATENTQFWKHLTIAHFITGVEPTANQPIWGVSHPASVYPGGFTVINALSGGGAQQMFGRLILRLHGCLTCANAEDGGNGTGTGSPLSPKHAWQIDSKMDDGQPGTGDVEASAYGNGPIVQDCEVAYNQAREDAFCVMSFVMKR